MNNINRKMHALFGSAAFNVRRIPGGSLVFGPNNIVKKSGIRRVSPSKKRVNSGFRNTAKNNKKVRSNGRPTPKAIKKFMTAMRKKYPKSK